MSCLQWTGFIGVSILYKIFEISQLPDKSQSKIYDNLFGQISNRGNHWHTIFRSVNYFIITWLMVLIVDFSMKANVNIGIMISIQSLSVVFIAIFSAYFFREKLRISIYAGIAMILFGAIGITLTKHFQAKENQESINGQTGQSKVDNQDFGDVKYMYYAIGIAVLSALLNSSRVLQAKYLNKMNSYTPVQFSIDSALTCGMIQLVISIYYLTQNHPGYTLYNMAISFLAGAFMQCQSLLSLWAAVKGLAAPSAAILNTHPMITTIQFCIVYQEIPNIFQVFGVLVIFSGVLMTVFNNSTQKK
eukprot:403375710